MCFISCLDLGLSHTLGIFTFIRATYVCQFAREIHTKNTYAKMRGRNYIHGPNTCMLKLSLGQLKMTCDTRIIHFDYTLEQL